MLLWKWIQPIVHHQSATIYGNVTPMGFLTLIVTKPTPNLRQRILLSISATNKSLSYPQFYCTIILPPITLTKTDRNGNRFGSIEIKLYFFIWYSMVFFRVSKFSQWAKTELLSTFIFDPYLLMSIVYMYLKVSKSQRIFSTFSIA